MEERAQRRGAERGGTVSPSTWCSRPQIANVEVVPFAVNLYEYRGCEEGSFGVRAQLTLFPSAREVAVLPVQIKLTACAMQERYECYVAACTGSLDPKCLPASGLPDDPWNGQTTGRALTCVSHDYDGEQQRQRRRKWQQQQRQ